MPNVSHCNRSVFRGKPTVAHNCHIKTKCSQQIQIAHSKFKSLTANSDRSQQITNCSQQIQIAHSKFKSLTANYKLLTAIYKSLAANSNRSQQIQIAHSKLQIAHSKFKSLTANLSRSQQIQESAFLSRVEGIFSSVPILH